MADTLNTHLMEIRYKPNSKMLDYRGAWADAITGVMDYQHWRVDQNRIDVWDELKLHTAFVAFRNAGFAVKNAHTNHYFPDHAEKFMKVLFQLEGFDPKPFIDRVGVRSKFCVPFDGTFNDLLELYSSKFVILTGPAKDTLNAKLMDIGSPLVLEDEIAKINFMGGPMTAQQIGHFFELSSNEGVDPPEVGLVFDIDYWCEPKVEMAEKELVILLKKFASACWSMFDRTQKLILE